MIFPSHSMDTRFLVYDITTDSIIACETGEDGVVPDTYAFENPVEFLDISQQLLQNPSLRKKAEKYKKELYGAGIHDAPQYIADLTFNMLPQARPYIQPDTVAAFVAGEVDIHGNVYSYCITSPACVPEFASALNETIIKRLVCHVASYNGTFTVEAGRTYSSEYAMFEYLAESLDPEIMDQLLTEPYYWHDGIFVAKYHDLLKGLKKNAYRINNGELLSKINSTLAHRPPFVWYCRPYYTLADFNESPMLFLFHNAKEYIRQLKPEEEVRKLLKEKYIRR